MNTDAKIERFFDILEIENQYYSTKTGQPIYMVTQEQLKAALKEVFEDGI